MRTLPSRRGRIRRAMRNDKLATGILTVIVGVVMAIVVAMVAYILFQGVGQLFQPGFLTEASRSNVPRAVSPTSCSTRSTCSC